MKYSCNNCADKEPPCILDIADSVQPEIPLFCPYNNNPKWELNGICSDCDDASGFSNEDAIKSQVDTAISENVRSDAEIKDKDYRQESIVSKNKIKIDEMINAHWSYIERVIRTSNEYGRYMPQMTLDEALKIREFDYKTAAKHFYGHGHEDGVIDMAKNTVERLRK